IFSVAGVYPARWTPVDSLAVQGYVAQQLDYTTTPLDNAVLANSLGIARTMRWFPVNPSGAQHPYDPGPYRTLGMVPRPGRAGVAGGTGGASASPASQPPTAVARAAVSVLALTRDLPYGHAASHWDAASAWAVNGDKVAGGGAMLAGVVPVPEPIPSAWFQVAV